MGSDSRRLYLLQLLFWASRKGFNFFLPKGYSSPCLWRLPGERLWLRSWYMPPACCQILCPCCSTQAQSHSPKELCKLFFVSSSLYPLPTQRGQTNTLFSLVSFLEGAELFWLRYCCLNGEENTASWGRCLLWKTSGKLSEGWTWFKSATSDFAWLSLGSLVVGYFSHSSERSCVLFSPFSQALWEHLLP